MNKTKMIAGIGAVIAATMGTVGMFAQVKRKQRNAKGDVIDATAVVNEDGPELTVV